MYKDCSRKNSTFGLGKFKRLSGACTNHYLSHPPLDKRGAHWNNDYYFPKAYILPALPVSVFMAVLCTGVGWRLQAHVCIHAYEYMPERCRRLLLYHHLIPFSKSTCTKTFTSMYASRLLVQAGHFLHCEFIPKSLCVISRSIA